MTEAIPAIQNPLVRCRHIMCKEMLVFGDDYLRTLQNPDGNTGFWCEKTRGACGPDDDLVSLRTCQTNRDCYEAL